jgi:hypothetical protein
MKKINVILILHIFFNYLAFSQKTFTSECEVNFRGVW